MTTRTDTLKCRDIYGVEVEINPYDLRPFTLYGMDLPAINALRLQYLERNGPLPMTVESITRTFNNGNNS